MKPPLWFLGPLLTVRQHRPGSVGCHGDDKAVEDHLPVHQHKRPYTLFLLWRTSKVGDWACWRCVNQPPQAPLDLLFLGTWRGYKMSAAEPHAVEHLYVQPPACCGEKPLSACSASQEQMGTPHRGSRAKSCWWAAGSGLVQRSTGKLYLPRL